MDLFIITSYASFFLQKNYVFIFPVLSSGLNVYRLDLYTLHVYIFKLTSFARSRNISFLGIQSAPPWKN